jgi:glutamate--cysteine ligase catalytic subunit
VITCQGIRQEPSLMGLLSLGTPLSWEEAAKLADHVRTEGIKQFINAYNKGQVHNPNFWTWGDEVSKFYFSYTLN